MEDKWVVYVAVLKGQSGRPFRGGDTSQVETSASVKGLG